jgi:hypothetical protein
MSLTTYQWIKGDRAGDVVKSDGTILQEGDINFLVFTDGTRCNENLLGDFIMSVASENEEDLILLNEIAPQPLQVVNKPKPEAKPTEKSNPVKKVDSPLVSLLSTAKKNPKTVKIELTIDVPPYDLIRVLAGSFEDGNEQILNYLISTFTPEAIDEITRKAALDIMADILEEKENLEKYERV